MIPYRDLEKGLGRWKARLNAPQASQASGSIGGGEDEPRKKVSSKLDWSMDQAMGSTPSSVDGETGTAEIGVESVVEDDEASAAPSAETTGDSTNEIDVNQIEPDDETR